MPYARRIPGLVRIAQLEQVRRLELGTTFSARGTSGGSVLVRPDGSPFVIVVDARLSQARRIEASEACLAKAMALCEEKDLLALAGPDVLTMLDQEGNTRWVLPYPSPLTERSPWVTCHFSADASLFWLLLPTGIYRERGSTLLVVDPSCGEVLEEREIQIALDEGPSWWIEGPHPTAPAIFLEGGMGQDGSISVLATFESGRLALDRGKRSVTFVAYGDSGSSYASLSHYGHRLDWDRYPSREGLSSTDLGRLFEELDDGHNWGAHSLGGRRLLVPSCEGRLLVVDPRQAEAVELRLEGDERTSCWSTIVVAGTSLVTARSGDGTLTAWGLGEFTSS